MSYEDPNAVLRREQSMPVTTAGGTTLSNAFRSFQKTAVKALHLWPVVSGTTSVHGYDLMINTVSVGVVTLGSGGTSQVDVAFATTLNPGDRLQIKSKTDATGTVEWVVEHQVLPEAVRT